MLSIVATLIIALSGVLVFFVDESKWPKSVYVWCHLISHFISTICYRPNRLRIKLCDPHMCVRYYTTQWLLERWWQAAGTPQILLHHQHGTDRFSSGHCRLSARQILWGWRPVCCDYCRQFRCIRTVLNVQYRLYDDHFEEDERADATNKSATCLIGRFSSFYLQDKIKGVFFRVENLIFRILLTTLTALSNERPRLELWICKRSGFLTHSTNN